VINADNGPDLRHDGSEYDEVMMDNEDRKPVILEPTADGQQKGSIPWKGVFLGALIGVLLVHPISMVVRAIHDLIYGGIHAALGPAFFDSFRLEMWPMMTLYAVLGAAVGAALGVVLRHLQENRQRLDNLHQEFELQVATLVHHYKNLAIGIQGFAGRVRKKLDGLEKDLQQSGMDDPPILQECEDLTRNVEILEEASQRLSQTLGEEVKFLKALTSDSLVTETRDFFPILIRAIQELEDLRFRDKQIQTEINGKPLENFTGSLSFAFEPYAMEVILQNILSNSMKFGNHIQVDVKESDGRVRVEIRDNGPGLEVEKLKENLLTPTDRQTAESTHLGLRVTIHLIYKIGGRLLVWSQPGAGAEFIVDLPKQPAVKATEAG
jgi:signal transduction histidine kinase